MPAELVRQRRGAFGPAGAGSADTPVRRSCATATVWSSDREADPHDASRGRPRRPLGMMSPMPSGPHVEQFEDGVVLTLSGELDAYDAPTLRSAFADAVAVGDASVIVLDLAAVSFLDSTALGSIVGLLRRVREAGGELRVLLPESDARRIFELTALDVVLDVHPSRASALAG
jgi:anti-sigma B factor antagonist